MRKGVYAAILGIGLAGTAVLMRGMDTEDITEYAPVFGERHYFKTKTVRGEPFDMREFLKEEEPVVVNYWATWCEPCREETKELQKLYDDGKKVVGIACHDSDDAVKSFLATHPDITYTIVIADDNLIALYKLESFPTTDIVLESATGKPEIVRRISGGASYRQLLKLTKKN